MALVTQNIPDISTFFVRKDYITNEVRTYNQSGVERYWTRERLERSLEYQYHVYAIARRIFVREQFESLVDVGCGPGVKTALFFRDLSKHVTLVDQPSISDVVKTSFPSASFYAANIENERLELHKKFDMVICSDVIEHLENPNTLMHSIRDALTVGGICILSTPDREIRRGASNIQSPNKEHVREWNKSELAAYLEFCGFRIISHINVPIKKEGKFKELARPMLNWFAINKSKALGNQLVQLAIR